MKLQGKKMILNIIQVYAPTADSTEEQLIEFYNDVQKLSVCVNHKNWKYWWVIWMPKLGVVK